MCVYTYIQPMTYLWKLPWTKPRALSAQLACGMLKQVEGRAGFKEQKPAESIQFFPFQVETVEFQLARVLEIEQGSSGKKWILINNSSSLSGISTTHPPACTGQVLSMSSTFSSQCAVGLDSTKQPLIIVQFEKGAVACTRNRNWNTSTNSASTKQKP